ncbi:Hydroxymethylbutenyl pyrophosphate reductase [Elusimicrobium minutum Pei191]|uniref:4-hydroxy-3-methylbut-2-enyl diphosphate reductase n=1 Tax=Elusimicrobium minutum (strain Pei191) TaxID=445932 RepID=B2KBE4_ELUMP|nr:4-hydroxy-3-methylbut-2-enyl diphosphate reductase [Elusimicrobium minutum]ACC97966.1 Hydroxymethylbutenyl pyrophosphate reductase [Elusimicrobium minutum Pei191]
MKEKDYGVTIAKSAGFCPGVKKAIDKVLELESSGKKPIFTLGPLIHNNQVIATLEEKGITSIGHPSEVEGKEGVLVIRAHGITPEFQREVESCGKEVIDATCPLVKHVHNNISKYAGEGYTTVIVGDAGHAEVIGLLGYTQGRGYVVADESEVLALPDFDKVNIVAQTTQKEAAFYKLAELIKQKAKEAVVSNTICEPTKQRQSETIEYAKNADFVIVVGGKNSANTARLAKLCGELAPKVLHVETEADLEGHDLKTPKKIFITAGASTPNWLIDRISGAVKNARMGAMGHLANFLYKMWAFIINSSLYTAFAALGLTYVCMKLQGVLFHVPLLVLSWLFVFSLTVINRGVSKTGQTEKRLPITIGVIAGAAALVIAFTLGFEIFIATAVFLGAGVLYPFRYMFKIKKFTSLPATKDLFTALGWSFVCAYLPAQSLDMPFTNANYLVIFYAVLLVFVRSVILGIGAAHKDIMIGKESFYKAFGLKVTRVAIIAIIAAVVGVLITLLIMGWKVKLVTMLLLGNIYIIFIAAYYYLQRKPRNIMEETLVDGQFLVLAALCFLARFI